MNTATERGFAIGRYDIITVDVFFLYFLKSQLYNNNYCRDLKPENLLLSDQGDSSVLKIADFGLSAVVFAAESQGSTASVVNNTSVTPFTQTPPGNSNVEQAYLSKNDTKSMLSASVPPNIKTNFNSLQQFSQDPYQQYSPISPASPQTQPSSPTSHASNVSKIYNIQQSNDSPPNSPGKEIFYEFKFSLITNFHPFYLSPS